MKNGILLLLSFVIMPFCTELVGQADSLNMTSLCRWDDDNLPTRANGDFSDIWGYADAAGNEVAILAGINAIFFIDVSNCTLIDSFNILNSNGTNNNTIWRDFKTNGQYAYAAADEGTSGLIIFDLGDIPNSVTKVYQSTQFWSRSHNIFIDEPNDRLYAAGANTRSNGLIVLDISGALATDPVELADPSLPDGYVHDVFVKNNIAYASHGSNDGLVVYNFDDPANPVTMGTYDNYPQQGYNHSSWVNDDDSYIVFCDETFGTSVKRLEITGMNVDNNIPANNNISFGDVELFKSTLETATNSIAHNPFIKGDLVYVAYYHDGVQVYDISDPNNVPRVAYYDTYPTNTNYSGFFGAWGVYPYLPSGKIIASDILNGLYTLEINLDEPLPLEFVKFDAKVQGEEIYLQWQVTGFEESAQFELMMTDDPNKTFEKIESIKYTIDQNIYKHIVGKLETNKVYYFKVEVKNQDGTKASTAVRSVLLPGLETLKIRNTMVKDQRLILANGPQNLPFQLEVYTLDGKLVHAQKSEFNDAQEVISLPNLTPQMYVARVQMASIVYAEKFMVEGTR